LFDETSDSFRARRLVFLPRSPSVEQPKRRFFNQYTTNPTKFILQPPPDTAGMAKKPEPPKPIVWNVYKFASKAVWMCWNARPYW
jgi:hypothetical protein